MTNPLSITGVALAYTAAPTYSACESDEVAETRTTTRTPTYETPSATTTRTYETAPATTETRVIRTE